MRFAVIGCGSIGLRHISNLLQLGHEVVAYNRGQARRDLAKRRFNIPTFDSIDEMLDSNKCDAVIICSPNSLHKYHMISVIERGLHFFVEKPLAVELNDLSEMEADITKKGLISHVGANMRFHFGPMTVKEHLDLDFIGRPLWANFWGGMYLPDWHPAEDYREMYSSKKSLGGGAILDFIHEIDLMCWMFGEPKLLAAMARNSGCLDIETEDLVDVIMAFKTGMQGNLHVDYLQRPFQRGIHIIGEKGSLRWDLVEESVKVVGHDKGVSKTIQYPHGYIKNDMYVAQMEYFCSCIQGNNQSISGFKEGMSALKIAQNIKQSISTQQFVKR